MNLRREVPEAAMVAAFLRGEHSSPRFHGDLKKAMRRFSVDEALITRPDITSEQANTQRALVLGEYRGYRRNREMFIGVPDDLTWYEAELSRDEIGALRYVDYSYWNELTGHTHLVREGVASIRRGTVVFEVSNDRFLALAEQIRRGEYAFEPMILWGQDIDSPLEILEGHLRATALGLAGDQAPATIAVLAGLRAAPGNQPSALVCPDG